MCSSPCLPKGDDIAPKGTKKGSWGEKNLTLFTYKVYVYKTYYTQYICGVKMLQGKKGKQGKKCFQMLLEEEIT